MLAYKMEVLEELSKRGYSTYRLRHEKIMGERVIQQLREKKLVSWKTIDTLCRLLFCQPGDIVGYLRDEKDAFISDAPIKTKL